MRPLEYFEVEGPGAWTSTDRILAEALEIYERNVCQECGNHARIAYDPNLNGWFQVDANTTCEACAARERWFKDRGDTPVEPGQKVRVFLDDRKKASRRQLSVS